MTNVFLDSGYLIALINKKDNLHNVAVKASEKFHGPFLTTQLVLIELANSLCLPPQRPLAIKIIDKIQKYSKNTGTHPIFLDIKIVV